MQPAQAAGLVVGVHGTIHDLVVGGEREPDLLLAGLPRRIQVQRHIAESYAAVEGRNIELVNAYIPPYEGANRFNHEPRRVRKLLLHKRQRPA